MYHTTNAVAWLARLPLDSRSNCPEPRSATVGTPVALSSNKMSAALAVHSNEIPLTTAIKRPARLCYELFCEASRIPEWVTVVRSAHVNERNHRGRPLNVTFLAQLERATVGYRLHYEYRERDLGGTLSAWDDPFYNGHASSAVMSDFRDFAIRATQ